MPPCCMIFGPVSACVPLLPAFSCLQLVVGVKRSRSDYEGDAAGDGMPAKKVRTGAGARQWVTVYNKHGPMKQR